jgi:hypothetical protein
MKIRLQGLAILAMVTVFAIAACGDEDETDKSGGFAISFTIDGTDFTLTNGIAEYGNLPIGFFIHETNTPHEYRQFQAFGMKQRWSMISNDGPDRYVAIGCNVSSNGIGTFAGRFYYKFMNGTNEFRYRNDSGTDAMITIASVGEPYKTLQGLFTAEGITLSVRSNTNGGDWMPLQTGLRITNGRMNLYRLTNNTPLGN